MMKSLRSNAFAALAASSSVARRARLSSARIRISTLASTVSGVPIRVRI